MANVNDGNFARMRKAELVMLGVVAFCIEFLFLLILVCVQVMELADPARILCSALVGLFLVMTPLAYFRERKAALAKPYQVSIAAESHELPYMLKAPGAGCSLAMGEESLRWTTRNYHHGREVIYRDVRRIDSELKSAFVIRLTVAGKRLPIEINLSLFPKTEWPFILNTIVARAPGVELDQFVLDLADGLVPG